MKTNELMTVLKVAKDLGHGDVRVLYAEGGDKGIQYIVVDATLKEIGVQMQPEVALIITRSKID